MGVRWDGNFLAETGSYFTDFAGKQLVSGGSAGQVGVAPQSREADELTAESAESAERKMRMTPPRGEDASVTVHLCVLCALCGSSVSRP